MKLSVMERAKVRAESGCAENTIRCYPDVLPASKMRIEEAAKRLGLLDKLCADSSQPQPKGRKA